LNQQLIIIYDLDISYAKELLSQLKKREEFLFEIRMVTTQERLKEISEEVDLLLLSEEMSGVALGENIRKIIYLSEGRQDSFHMNKYQSIDKIAAYIEKNCEPMREEVLLGKQKGGTLVVIYSPVGGSGVTTITGELARYLAEQEQVVYSINFELISSFACEKKVDFFYDMKQRKLFLKENWKNYFSKQEGVWKLTTSLYNNELWNVDKEDILYFISGLQERREQAYYLLDLGFLNGAMLCLLDKCDYWLMPLQDGVIEQNKVKNMKALLEFRQMEEWKEKLIEVNKNSEYQKLFQGLVQ